MKGRLELPAVQVMSQCFTEDAIPPRERVQLLRTLPQSAHEAGDAQISPACQMLLAMRAADRQPHLAGMVGSPRQGGEQERPAGYRLTMMLRIGKAHEQAPPVVDQRHTARQQPAAFEIMRGEAAPAPLVLQFVECVLAVCPIAIQLTERQDLAVERGHQTRTNNMSVGHAMKPMSEAHFATLRRHMVEVIGIQVDLASEELGKAALDERVLAAMRNVPRHRFVPSFLAPLAYRDTPLPIGFDKTISQPFIVALMTDLLGPEPHESILEVGTGLGYQAAVLAELSGRVWSVEIVEELAGQAEANLRQLGCSDVAIRIGDGSRGWREHAPYDRALLTAAAERLPPAILDQIKPRGRIVLPLGPDEAQWLTVVDKGADGQTSLRKLIRVRFSRLETVV